MSIEVNVDDGMEIRRAVLPRVPVAGDVLEQGEHLMKVVLVTLSIDEDPPVVYVEDVPDAHIASLRDRLSITNRSRRA